MSANKAHEETRTDSGSDVRDTEYAADLTSCEAHPGSTHFDADTGRRLKKAAIILAIVFGVAFLLVSIDRFFKARAVA
ncbi:MAG: hypothetical protein WAN26_14225, partial [Steroidobacteraceae bacterium]